MSKGTIIGALFSWSNFVVCSEGNCLEEREMVHVATLLVSAANDCSFFKNAAMIKISINDSKKFLR